MPILELKYEIPVTVSLRLQAQCSYMCAKEPNREWSGVLFYSTSGVFGEEDFQITGEEFYLMDIGTSTFTGYDYEPDFISYMMSNPKLLKLKKGHIHSHNTMNVFFSGTDTDEIRDNSEFHNYYFSLIVNNKNEMTAKVAFRGKQVTKSATSYSYKGDNGAERTGFYETTVENDVCYVYNTIIDNSFHNDLSSKYQIIKSRPTVPLHSVTEPNGATVKQKELPFPDTKGKKEDKSFYWETDEEVDVWGDEARQAEMTKNQFSESPVSDSRSLNFIAKVMVGDMLAEDPLSEVIKRFSGMKQWELDAFQGRMEKRLMNFYIDYFPEDPNLTLFDDVMSDCQDLVQMYDPKYNKVTDMLWEVFNTEIK